MFTSRLPFRQVRIARGWTLASLGLALLVAPVGRIGAQSNTAAADQWRAWAFVRLGPAQTEHHDGRGGNAVFVSLGGGVAASYGSLFGMLRETDNESGTFSDNPPAGMLDYALLAGARTRGDRLFFAAAAGIGQAKPSDSSTGVATPSFTGQLVPAFDLSAHADYRVAGLSLTISGVLGPPSTRYVAISLGAELGWFGF
jgi:hypothetical protein